MTSALDSSLNFSSFCREYFYSCPVAILNSVTQIQDTLAIHMVQFTHHTPIICLMYKFHSKMIVEVHGKSIRRNILPSLGFEPTMFQLMPSCQDIAFLTIICISPLDHFALLVDVTS